jgi:Ca2+:H+ antiporter
MLLLAIAALIMPAIFELVEGSGLPSPGSERVDYDGTVEHLSLAVAIVLIASYVAGLVFSLRTHRALFNPAVAEPEALGETWSVRRSVLLLALAGGLVGVMSEVLVGSIEQASHSVGLSTFFIGVFVVGIAGNAAEHWVAVVVALKNKMDLSLNIAVGSSVQIAMFLVPLLVLLSLVFGPDHMALTFNWYEVVALLTAGAIARYVTHGGHSTRNEGALLIAVYVALGVVFLLA